MVLTPRRIMGAIRVVVFFNDVQNQAVPSGWSESYYWAAVATIDQVYTPAKTMVRKRQALLGSGIKVPYLRVSDVTTYRDSLVVSNLPPLVNLTAGLNDNLLPI